MTELLAIFVDNIAPILIIAGIGYIVGRLFEIDAQSVSRVIFNVLSPALVFQVISTSTITGSELVLLVASVAVFMLTMASLAYIVTGWIGVSRLPRAAVILGAICANNGNFGLPLVTLAFGPEVVARAAVIFVTVTISNYSLGVFVASSGSKPPLQALRNVLKVPSVYAACFGLFLNFTDLQLPFVLAQPIQRLSQATVPMMLLLLGLQLSSSSHLVRIRLVSLGITMRLLVSPFVAAIIALLVGLNDTAMVALIMQASMPVAVVTIILATEYELDRQLSLSMILASTLISPVTLSLLIFVLRRLVPGAL